MTYDFTPVLVGFIVALPLGALLALGIIAYDRFIDWLETRNGKGSDDGGA